MVDGKVFRKIDSRCWDTERRLEDMAADAHRALLSRDSIGKLVLTP